MDVAIIACNRVRARVFMCVGLLCCERYTRFCAHRLYGRHSVGRFICRDLCGDCFSPEGKVTSGVKCVTPLQEPQRLIPSVMSSSHYPSQEASSQRLMDTTKDEKMIPVGYMFKSVGRRPDQLPAINVEDSYSAGSCGGSTSQNFADYIGFWKHNGYWFFNSPSIMEEIARENDIDLSTMTLFYYEAYRYEFDLADDDTRSPSWSTFDCEPSFPTDIAIPEEKDLVGYDVVEFVFRNSPGCSLLACTDLTAEFAVNEHCLFEKFEQAKEAVESGAFHACEPGPYRIFAVYLCRKSNSS
jgi:hypothetical protein